ncbi:peptidyl-prolyl cis-trans isomerase-like 3 isoform X1 [Anas platyrhynchos]|uniref:peptidyl-prolyl cis-trans isomerase-like 3 isoform X1 n=1 Tax=Anas platyrhynchos TaxID=8839 RepID=UPI000F7C1485|eukprot:XP_005014593.2 peptidyl-prolyl cis-trans isomerase-like 3 isoform X1 [Anas platyrhynchos]
MVYVEVDINFKKNLYPALGCRCLSSGGTDDSQVVALRSYLYVDTGNCYIQNYLSFLMSRHGTGKGGNSIWGKKFEDEFSEYLKHSVRGVVSMANNGPNTNGSQFFITYGKQPHLDMKYTVFGKVIDGLESLDELEKLPVNEKTYRPLNDVRIKDITIHANPFAV